MVDDDDDNDENNIVIVVQNIFQSFNCVLSSLLRGTSAIQNNGSLVSEFTQLHGMAWQYNAQRKPILIR